MATDPTPQYLRVRDWRTKYENNRTRELKSLDWVPISNKMDTDAYIELIDHPEGPAHGFVWLACVMIASRCENPALRGVLLRDDGTPHTAASVARQCRIPAPCCDVAIKRLLEMKVLELVNASSIVDLPIPHPTAGISHNGAMKSHRGATTRARGEGNGREGNTTTPPIPPSGEGGRSTTKKPTREDRKRADALAEIESHREQRRH